MNKILEFLYESFIITAFFILLATPVGVIAGVIRLRRDRFYIWLAEKHNLTYRKDQQIDLMKGFRSRLFRYDRTIKTQGVFEGEYKNHTFHIFNKTFYARDTQVINLKRGFKDFSKTFTIGSCEFGTTEFPHILLKSKRMPLYQSLESKDRKISIEEEYLKDFDLYCPENYEIETFQIFTEHLLNSVQAISEQFSIEFGGNRMYIYINKNIQNSKNAENIGKMISIIKEIVDKTDGLLFRLKDDFEVLDVYFRR